MCARVQGLQRDHSRQDHQAHYGGHLARSTACVGVHHAEVAQHVPRCAHPPVRRDARQHRGRPSHPRQCAVAAPAAVDSHARASFWRDDLLRHLVARGQAADHRQQRAHVHHLPRRGYGLPHATPHGVQVTIPSNVRALPRRERWSTQQQVRRRRRLDRQRARAQQLCDQGVVHQTRADAQELVRVRAMAERRG